MKHLLKLYVIGKTPNNQRAISNLKKIAQESLKGQYLIEVIDILKNPKLAVDENIVATPTLIKSLPPPLRKVIGNLSNIENVLLGLGLKPIIEASTSLKENDDE